MRSLTLKVILAFAAVCLVEALMVAFLVRDSTRRSFDRFVEEEALRIFTEDISSYYEANGNLDGLGAFLPTRDREPPPRERARRRPPERRGEAGPRGPRYGFADTTGLVIVANTAHRTGEILSEEEIEAGKLVSINPSLKGIILYPQEAPQINPQALEFLRNTDTALLFALGGGFSVALVLGALFARSYMKPLKELTIATQEIARGTTHEPVEVRTKDEIGVLTGSFNQMAAELERSKQSRRQMTADIAHELRSPLGILTGYLEAFQGGDLQPSPDRMKTMFAEAKHLELLVEDLRLLALADAGELPLALEMVQTGDLLRQSKEAYAQAGKDAQVELKVAVTEALPVVALDPNRMKQVLNNLIRNALRYTPAGGSITLSARRLDKQIEIRVQDTGTGIDPKALPHIFDRFYKADPSRTNHLETSGLGLAIVKSVVEAHRGKITATSEKGVGTTFFICLPLSR